MDENPYELGVIRGRFQVLHNDHLRCLLAGNPLCNHLTVGITSPCSYRVKNEAADPQQCRGQSVTFYERCCLLKAGLVEADAWPGTGHGNMWCRRLSRRC
jgi:nicotinamide-nucleotide adenylyltransferase